MPQETEMVAGQKLPDILSIALYTLSNKDSRGFEDILWLAVVPLSCTVIGTLYG